MSKMINKNFGFMLNDEVQFNGKSNIINSINKVHTSIYNKEFSGVISELRKVVETTIREYIKINSPGIIIEQLSLIQLTEFIKKTYGNLFDLKILDAIHIVRKWGNNDAHNYSDCLLSEVVVALKSIQEIIWYCFYKNIKIDSFEEMSYFSDDNNNKVPSINTINQYENQYKPMALSNDIEIVKNQLIHWVFRSGVILMIPIYQRGYTWNEEQIETLFNDIVNRMKDGSSHYFGIIAGKIINDSGITGKSKIKIIDGQQRLTSSFLFFCAVRDVMLENGLENIDDEKILSNIFKINSIEKIEDYFYNPGGENILNETFRKILRGDFDIINKTNAFYKNYYKFKELIDNKKLDFAELRDLVHTFVTKFELGTITFDAKNVSNKKEMEIFENLNSKGKELSPEDLIKNFIFNLCSDELLEKYDDKDISLIFNSSIIAELKNEKLYIQEFYKSLIHYNIGVEFKDNKQNQLTEFKKVIQKLFGVNMENEINTIDNYKKLLDKIKKYAQIFYDVSGEKNKKIVKWLNVENIIILCDKKDKQRLFVGLTYLIYEFLKKDNKFDISTKLSETILKDIRKMYITIMKAITKNSIVTIQGDSSFKRTILKSIYLVRQDFLNEEKITLLEMGEKLKLHIKESTHTDQEFKSALINNTKTSKAIVWLLVLTEWEMSDSLNSGQAIVYSSPSIEHILPQNTIKWEEELQQNKDYDELSFQENKERHLQKIGNYFIINKPKNSSASNKIFSEKKEIYKVNTSPLFVNQKYENIDISKKDIWNFKKIEERTEELVDYICTNVIKDQN